MGLVATGAGATLFLRNALALLPDVELYGVTPQEWAAGTARDATWDLVVLEGVVPDPLPQAPILAFAPPASSPLGEVSGTENFGVFVTVSNPYGEGLIPVARLRDDYYEKDPDTGHLVGRRHGRRFELGQKIRVKVSRSDPFAAQIDFDFLGFA